MKRFLNVYCLKLDGSDGSSSLCGVSMRTHGLAPSSDQHVWRNRHEKENKSDGSNRLRPKTNISF